MRRKRSGGNSSYCLSAWFCLPVVHSSKTLHRSQLAVAKNTHTHTRSLTHKFRHTLNVSLSPSYDPHTLGRKFCWVTVQTALSLFLSFPDLLSSLHHSLNCSLLPLCLCVCHYSYVAGGGGDSSGPVWPIH